jgi:hypothetical protein
MNLKKPCRTALIVLALCGSAFLGARTLAQEAAPSNYDRDAAEFDRTRDAVSARLTAMAEALKQSARDATPQKDAEEDKKERNARIEKALQSFFQDTYVLALQTHLLTLDSMVDHGGAAVEGAVLGTFAARLKVPIAELVDRREKSGLGLGGVALGYAIARAAEVPADEIFTNKQGSRTWLDIMSSRQVTLEKLKTIFEEK